MPKRSNVFQTLIYQLQHHFSDENKYKITESKELKHRITGKLREVDIVIESCINDVPIMICFECTSQKRTVDSLWVEGMIGKHLNLETNQLVLVSDSGFSKPARELAEQSRSVIALSMQEVEEADWTEFTKNFQDIVFSTFTLKLIDVNVSYVKPDGVEIPEGDKGSLVFHRASDGFEIGPLELGADVLKNSEPGRLVMKRWFKEEIKKGKKDFEVTINLDPNEDPFVLRGGDRYYEIKYVKVRANVSVESSRVDFKHSSFLETKVSHALLPDPFSEHDPHKGENAILAVTENEHGRKLSISLPGAKSGEQKIFFANWEVGET